jgi:hypothetical protein
VEGKLAMRPSPYSEIENLGFKWNSLTHLKTLSELADFAKSRGNVAPRSYSENTKLGTWSHTRVQYKLHTEGKKSLTYRIQELKACFKMEQP